MRRRPPRGQLAIGLAVSFTSVLAIFALVFQSALTTSEKMKLQQTTDLAALRAAHVQRVNLDLIRDDNEFIESLYVFYWALLQVSPCNILVLSHSPTGPSATAQAYGFAVPLERAISGVSLEVPPIVDEIDIDHFDPSADPLCNRACGRLDAAVRKALVIAYHNGINSVQGLGYVLNAMARVIGFDLSQLPLGWGRNGLAANIQNRLEKANQIAFERAMEVFFDVKNLPLSLRRHLQGETGSPVSSAEIRWKYQQGEFDEFLELENTQAGFPLFVPETEWGAFPAATYYYQTVPMAPATYVCSMGVPSGPTTLYGTVKVTRADAYPTSYLAVAKYYPRFWQGLYNPQLRDPNFRSAGFGKRLSIQGDASSRYARTLREEPTPMLAYAFAKPYGGSFPSAGRPLFTAATPGELGAPFQGAKLIGIADPEALEGFDILTTSLRSYLQGEIPILNAEGNWTAMTFYREDFLH